MDSQSVVKTLHEVDPGFVALCDTLYGPTVDPSEAWGYLYGGVAKMSPDPSAVHSPGAVKAARGVLVPRPPMNGATVPPAVASVPKPVKAPTPRPVTKPTPKINVGVGQVGKADDELEVVWEGEFSKRDDERRQAFGWASVVQVNGEPVVDLQGDWITPDELERAAYHYVRKSRVGGSQHARAEDGGPLRAGDLIESVVYTDEKYAALAKSMDLPAETFADAPRAWWVGFQYDDEATWDDIKTGRKTGFSVHGRGKRTPVEIGA